MWPLLQWNDRSKQSNIILFLFWGCLTVQMCGYDWKLQSNPFSGWSRMYKSSLCLQMSFHVIVKYCGTSTIIVVPLPCSFWVSCLSRRMELSARYASVALSKWANITVRYTSGSVGLCARCAGGSIRRLATCGVTAVLGTQSSWSAGNTRERIDF